MHNIPKTYGYFSTSGHCYNYHTTWVNISDTAVYNIIHEKNGETRRCYVC